MLTGIIKKADIILLIALLALGGATAAFGAGSNLIWPGKGQGSGSGAGKTVIVRAGGKEYGKYDLGKDQTIRIKRGGKSNTVQISSGRAKMLESNCRNHICIDMGEVSSPGQMIICLPNRITIEIKGDGGHDAVVG